MIFAFLNLEKLDECAQNFQKHTKTYELRKTKTP